MPVDHLAHLTREAAAYGAALEDADFDAPVPGCPGWTVRALTRHTGDVHRWALRRATGSAREAPADVGDHELAAWFADGAARLCTALTEADPTAPCRGFEDETTVAFWLRRQAHETAVHRGDLQSAAGRADPPPAELAADGIAEVLEVFAPRQVRLGRTQPPAHGLVLVTPEGHWTLPGPAPVTVRGSSADVLLMLWGRQHDVQASDEAALRQVLDGGLTP